MYAVGNSSLIGGPPPSLALDDLAVADAAQRHARELAVLAPDHVGLRAPVVVLEHAHGLADEPVRQLELERDALADVARSHEVLALSAGRISDALPRQRLEPLARREQSHQVPERPPDRRPAHHPM